MVTVVPACVARGAVAAGVRVGRTAVAVTAPPVAGGATRAVGVASGDEAAWQPLRATRSRAGNSSRNLRRRNMDDSLRTTNKKPPCRDKNRQGGQCSDDAGR